MAHFYFISSQTLILVGGECHRATIRLALQPRRRLI